MRGRGRQKAPTKVSTTIRLSPEVIAHFRAGGPGWQWRIDEALKDWVARRGRVGVGSQGAALRNIAVIPGLRTFS
ncbi:MAG TPA: BrnA antitoxin family protein [Novosphingobium sp.]|nr:BrnA antitoxin family protein [Novosphingobium sp.]